MGDAADLMSGADVMPSSVDVNVDDSFSALFREIGTTLKDVTKQGISTVGDTVKIILANKIMESPQGQAQISAYKAQYFFKYLPWLLLIGVGLFFGGKLLHHRA